MRRLLPLTVYCISLISLRQLLAAPIEERPGGGVSSDFLSKLISHGEDNAPMSDPRPRGPAPSSAPLHWAKLLPGFLRRPPASGARSAQPSPSPLAKAWRLETRGRTRVRRHAHPGLRGGHHHNHHAQLMRVGCVLGTCQVQNLSHRLYQLIGQSGREDSSPINPKSPHSYG